MPNGTDGVNIAGITVYIPPIDSSIAHAQEVQDVSLCVVMLQMCSYIADSTISASIQRAVVQALSQESQQLAQEVFPPS